jgi:Uma2 family endonuclease
MTASPLLPRANLHPPPGRVSFEAFMAWCDEDAFAEWTEEGGVEVMFFPGSRHQDVLGFLACSLGVFAEEHGLGETIPTPFVTRLPASARMIDLVFVATEHLGRLKPAYLDGPADLAVEVVSPTSGARDRGAKFYAYEVAGVAEYWIVDPEREEVEAYALRDGRYRSTFAGHAGRLEATALPGCWLDVTWLWGDLPPLMDVLRAWNLV